MPKRSSATRGRQAPAGSAAPAPERTSRSGDHRPLEEADGAGGEGDVEVTWRAYATPIICLLGLAAATYLTIAHYTQSGLAVCPENSVVNCLKVTTSAESFVFGIPVALLGAIYFLPMLALCLPAAWRSANPYVAPARLAGAFAGMGFVFYLLYAELFVIKAICLWCTSVHVLTFLLFLCVMTGWADGRAAYWARLDEAA